MTGLPSRQTVARYLDDMVPLLELQSGCCSTR